MTTSFCGSVQDPNLNAKRANLVNLFYAVSINSAVPTKNIQREKYFKC